MIFPSIFDFQLRFFFLVFECQFSTEIIHFCRLELLLIINSCNFSAFLTSHCVFIAAMKYKIKQLLNIWTVIWCNRFLEITDLTCVHKFSISTIVLHLLINRIPLQDICIVKLKNPNYTSIQSNESKFGV